MSDHIKKLPLGVGMLTIFNAANVAANEHAADVPEQLSGENVITISGGVQSAQRTGDLLSGRRQSAGNITVNVRSGSYLEFELGGESGGMALYEPGDESDLTRALVRMRNNGTISWLSDDSHIEIGRLGDARVFEGALNNFYGQGRAPLLAGQGFLFERLENFEGISVNLTVPAGSKWQWDFSGSVGKTRQNVSAFKYSDIYHFIKDRDVNVAPAIRGEALEAVNEAFERAPSWIPEYFPDAQQQILGRINSYSDADIQEGFERLFGSLVQLEPYLENTNIEAEEYVAAIGALGNGPAAIGAENVTGAIAQVKAGHGNVDNAVLIKTALTRTGKSSSISFGLEAGRVPAGTRTEADETYLSVFAKGTRRIGDNFELKGMFALAGFDGYSGLILDRDNDEKLLAGNGVIFGAAKWLPSKFDRRLAISVGGGMSADYFFGKARHREIGAVYEIVSRPDLSVNLYAARADVKYEMSLGENEGKFSETRAGILFSKRF
jgi:hypothetical protein